MNLRHFVFSVAPVLLLAGCATSPVPLARSRPTKPSRLFADYALYSQPVHSGAKLIIIRDTARIDRIERVQFQVDGGEIANLGSGERLELYVYPGDHILGLISTPGFLDAPDVDHSFVFRPGETYYFRVGVFGLTLDVRAASQSQARYPEK